MHLAGAPPNARRAARRPSTPADAGGAAAQGRDAGEAAAPGSPRGGARVGTSGCSTRSAHATPARVVGSNPAGHRSDPGRAVHVERDHASAALARHGRPPGAWPGARALRPAAARGRPCAGAAVAAGAPPASVGRGDGTPRGGSSAVSPGAPCSAGRNLVAGNVARPVGAGAFDADAEGE